ncbi:Iron import ATP-binding/permease protein IrtB [Streptomyces sp. YIM 130001]|uniref:ABC transporter ATP-binding protein n=1 Tax=Streptomyces sp. YIM 130001 TaxID=2259644 RepID=UPI000E6583CC|nr:ABC transporter ATP-binding protein [Streptomyces sp. YIM 130001]RII11727.1 Iron import ATP-binding/permease protein IrtB [Streptomyces sp. YIM 130001]
MIRSLLWLLPADRRTRAAAYAALALLSVLLRAVGVVLLVPLVRELFGAEPARALPWLGALTAVTAVGWVVDTVAARLGFDLGFALLDRVQHDVADRLTQVRLSWLAAGNVATARAAIASGGPELVGLFASLLTPLIGAVLLPAAIAVALVPVAWQLGLAAAAGVPVLLGALWASGRITRRADALAAETNNALTERLVEFAGTQQALRAARRVEPARSHVGRALEEQHGSTMRLLLLQVPGQVLFGLAGQAALVTLAAVAAWLTVRGDLTAPEAVALIVVVVRYLEPFTTLAELAPAVETIRSTLGRVRSVLTAPTSPSGTATAGRAGAPRLEFENVDFAYGAEAESPVDGAGGEPVLRGLNLTLEAGTTTAVVGPSGSGKSTVLALLAGLHTPTRGRVLVDGVDTVTLDGASRRSLTSMVFQHSYLFDGTVRENVMAGDRDADHARVEGVLGLARVDEIAARLPDGADSRVGEGGSALSGGERQRVGIARALLKPAPVLLVDEATSALDTENEAAVAAALSADHMPRTRVIVTHRPATVRSADRVLFLEDGAVIEDGTVDELLAAGGRFHTFWREAQESAAWRLRATDVAAGPSGAVPSPSDAAQRPSDGAAAIPSGS